MPRQEIDSKLFSPDTQEFLALLHKHQVRYLIVGGVPVIYYGHVRTTGDIDFFYDRSPDNTRQLFEALTEFWSGQIPHLHRWEELMVEGMILQFGVVPNRIDLINDINGVRFAEAWPNRLVLTMPVGAAQIDVFLIGLADLIQNKAATDRPKDGDDLRFLRRVK